MIGGSFALAAKEGGLVRRVVGVARRETTRAAAMEAGVVDEATGDAVEAVAAADLVYVSVPVGAVASVMAAIGPAVQAEALVTDGGSTKASTVAAAREHLRGRCTFIGGHPMAGSERSGPEAARADLFVGKTYILTPTDDTPPEALARLRGVVEAMGARVHLCDPDEHDRMVAFTSHLPHLLASSLCAMLADMPESLPALRPFVGSGFRDLTRIAKSPPEVWRDILRDNRAQVLKVLARHRGEVSRFYSAMKSDDPALLDALWQEAADFRRGLDEP